MADPEVNDKVSQFINHTASPTAVAVWLMWSTDKLLKRIVIMLTRIETKLGLPDEKDDDA